MVKKRWRNLPLKEGGAKKGDKIMTKETKEVKVTPQPRLTLKQDLANVFHKHRAQDIENTEDFILAEYLISCLQAFEVALRRRDDFNRGRAVQAKVESNKVKNQEPA